MCSVNVRVMLQIVCDAVSDTYYNDTIIKATQSTFSWCDINHSTLNE